MTATYLAGGLIEGSQSLANARTAGFTVLVFAQLFNSLNAHSETSSAFTHLFVNPWLWGAIALSLILQVLVVHVGWLNVAFGTVPLTLAMGSVPCDEQRCVVVWRDAQMDASSLVSVK